MNELKVDSRNDVGTGEKVEDMRKYSSGGRKCYSRNTFLRKYRLFQEKECLKGERDGDKTRIFQREELLCVQDIYKVHKCKGFILSTRRKSDK